MASSLVSCPNFSHLPVSLVCHVFSFLPLPSLISVCSVRSLFHSLVVSHPECWVQSHVGFSSDPESPSSSSSPYSSFTQTINGMQLDRAIRLNRLPHLRYITIDSYLLSNTCTRIFPLDLLVSLHHHCRRLAGLRIRFNDKSNGIESMQTTGDRTTLDCFSFLHPFSKTLVDLDVSCSLESELVDSSVAVEESSLSCPLSPSHLVSICESLPGLTALSLSNCDKIESFGFDVLVELRSLRQLRLRKCKIGEITINKLATALTRLHTLELTETIHKNTENDWGGHTHNCGLILDSDSLITTGLHSISSLPHLTYLDLSSSSYGPNLFHSLIHSLSMHTQLNSLALNYCTGFDDNCFSFIIKLLCSDHHHHHDHSYSYSYSYSSSSPSSFCVRFPRLICLYFSSCSVEGLTGDVFDCLVDPKPFRLKSIHCGGSFQNAKELRKVCEAFGRLGPELEEIDIGDLSTFGNNELLTLLTGEDRDRNRTDQGEKGDQDHKPNDKKDGASPTLFLNSSEPFSSVLPHLRRLSIFPAAYLGRCSQRMSEAVVNLFVAITKPIPGRRWRREFKEPIQEGKKKLIRLLEKEVEESEQARTEMAVSVM